MDCQTSLDLVHGFLRRSVVELRDDGVDLAFVVAGHVGVIQDWRRWVGFRVNVDNIKLASAGSQLFDTTSTKNRRVVVGGQAVTQ